MSNYILKGRTPVQTDDIIEWAKWFDNVENRMVARTKIDDPVVDIEVSTVFLGIDHNWGDGPPILYETMIFGGDYNEQQWRYETWEEAEAGHQRAVNLVLGKN